MGYYEGQRDRPCPRCGGIVATVFISVSPMSFWQRCGGCGATEFTSEEEALLGKNASPTAPMAAPIVAQPPENDAAT